MKGKQMGGRRERVRKKLCLRKKEDKINHDRKKSKLSQT
jgi:hypothetical protein